MTSPGSPTTCPPALDADLTDVTEDWGTLSLMGPRARDVLAQRHRPPMSPTPPSPSAMCAQIEIAGAPVRALRVTYVGELGWELHVPIAATGDGLRRADGRGRTARPDARRLPRDRIAAAGEGLPRLGLRHHAQRHPVRGGPRLGGEAEVQPALPWPRGARAQQRQAARRSCSPASPSPIPTSCSRAARRSCATASRVGYLTSGGYGYTVGKPIGYGYVRNAEGVTDD